MQRHGMALDEELRDCTTLNTPYQLQEVDSFIVHYMGMPPALRALLMHNEDRISQERDGRGF
ncbi:galactosyl transferase GMA12/MNN10 domain protein [Caballeronia fortuita]|uniref:Galactosyl transferase GMA12/MNN10 domain protein n=1 Tax=Caballeronia fortuita TaxID=1777138 RepID=A0A158B8I8_9BURK|nr:galactosyl transferase GMA12/MNN10 domain protein [Caballeronia fortuita]